MKKINYSIIFVCLILSIIACSTYVLLYFSRVHNIEIYGIACILILLLLPYIISKNKGNFDIFNPLTITNVAYFLYFVYTPFSDILTKNYMYHDVDIQPFISKGNLYVMLGIISMYVGYNSIIPKVMNLRNNTLSMDLKKTKKICYIFYIITFVCFTGYIYTVGSSWFRFVTLGQSDNNLEVNLWSNESPLTFYLLNSIDFIVPTFLLLVAITKKTVYYTILCLPLFLATITLGFRYKLIILFGSPIIYYYLKHKKRPTRNQIIVSILIAFMLVGAVGAGRASFRTGSEIKDNAFSFESMYDEFMINNAIYQPFYGMIHNIPLHHDYLYGKSFLYLAIQPIPRAIWPEKPDPPVKEIVYYSLFSEKAVKSGMAFPNIGEFYANFGVWGMIFGMYIFGMIQKLLYKYYRENEDNIFILVLYSIQWPFLLQYVSRGYFVQIFTAFLFNFLPLMIVYVFNRKKYCL